MSAPQPLVPSGSSTLELVQNLSLVLSASSQSRDEELGKVIGTFQTFLQEVKQDLAANAKKIAALEANVAALEAEKKELALVVAAERRAFDNLAEQVRGHANGLQSLITYVNADHKFLHEHFHGQRGPRQGYTTRGTW